MLSRVQIQNLNPIATDISVVGLLIAKSDVNFFQSGNSNNGTRPPKSKSNGNNASLSTDSAGVAADMRAVLTLTLRDAEHAFINCTVWGGEALVQSYAMRFHLGDVLTVKRPTVDWCKANDAYHPLTPSPYQLTVNPGNGAMLEASCAGDAHAQSLERLLGVPVKPTLAALRLIDVMASGASGATRRDERFADLLVVVQKMWPVKTLGAGKYGKGERLMRCVDVLDESTHGVRMTLWNCGFVKRSNAWKEMSTVLQLVDVRTAYSAFRRCVELSSHGRTLIVEDPNTREANHLRQIVRLMPPETMTKPGDGQQPWAAATTIDLSAIRTVMTVRQVQELMEESAGYAAGVVENTNSEFTALLFVVIAALDLDGCSDSVVVRRCNQCKQTLRTNGSSVAADNSECPNEDCRLSALLAGSNSEQPLLARCTDTFDIRVELIDHTGVLRQPACRLRDAAAERLLGCTAEAWHSLSDRRRGEIKWRWLLERCAVKLRVRRVTMGTNRAQWFADMVDCERADGARVLREIKMY